MCELTGHRLDVARFLSESSGSSSRNISLGAWFPWESLLVFDAGGGPIAVIEELSGEQLSSS